MMMGTASSPMAGRTTAGSRIGLFDHRRLMAALRSGTALALLLASSGTAFADGGNGGNGAGLGGVDNTTAGGTGGVGHTGDPAGGGGGGTGTVSGGNGGV